MMAGSDDDPRDRILSAALAVLERGGAAGLTVRAVAESAGCSTTGIYTHFGGKRQLVEAIFTVGFDSLDRFTEAVYERGDPVDVANAVRSWAVENETHYLVMFGRSVPEYRPSLEALDRVNRSFERLTRLLTASDVEDPLATASHIRAVVHGYLTLELAGLSAVGSGDVALLLASSIRCLLASR